MINLIDIKILSVNKRIKDIKNIISGNFTNESQKDKLLFMEYNNLLKIKNYFYLWKKYLKDLKFAQSLLKDKEFCVLAKEEVLKLKYLIKLYHQKLKKNLFIKNKNENDSLNIYLEIYNGTGGKESALFASDLLRMYTKYAEKMGWKVNLINLNTNKYGGYKEVILKIIGKNVYEKLKFESGGHRVQRIPITESQGRVHTSTCIVAVIPDIPSIKLPKIKNEDIKIDSFKSSGAGGQHVNTTDSAIRITHIPTGIVVECQQERSQHKNKAKALSILRNRIYSLALLKREKEQSLQRKSLLGTGLRNDRNRTYNYPQNRITDHRIKVTLYSLNEILNGNLDLLINKIVSFNDKK